MTLLKLCRQITEQNGKLLPKDHALGSRLVCMEYSKSAKEVKTYPLLSESRLFALCWNFSDKSRLYASMLPSPEAFHYVLPFQSGSTTQLHTHNYLELAYIVEGNFYQNILGRRILFHAGELCLIDKNCLHQDYLTAQDSTILFIGIANDMFHEVINENITTQKIISFLQSALLEQKDLQQYLHFRPKNGAASTAHMEDCLSLLLQELVSNTVGSSYICKGILLRIFRILSTEFDFSLSQEQKKSMSWLIFNEVTNYIKKNYQTICIQDLVSEFHYQEDYFNRLIKDKTGLTYSAYLKEIRLDSAKHLLLATDMSIEDIAHAVGYHNKGFFYKMFVDKYGMTPSKYRKSSD